MLLHYKFLSEDATEPTKAHKYDACWDLYASEDKFIAGWEIVGTSIAIRVPKNYMGLIMSRSGLAANEGMFVLNAPGVIDHGYHGEIKVILASLRDRWVMKGDRIAQFCLVELPEAHLLRGDGMVWGLTPRGEEGLGSSGY